MRWLGILCAAMAVWQSAAAEEARPNIVLILTDNQGAWTLGCYGNRDIRTPQIDRLAREGTLMERCYVSNPVCSPTRATLLTGLLPSQHGVHCYLPSGASQIGPDSVCTIAEFRSLPKIFAEAGYVCGLSGKWHLGGNLRPQEGFSDWTTLPHVSAHFHDVQIIDDGKLRNEPSYLTDFWTDRGVQFIERNKDRPFFLFLSYNGPYGLSKAMLEPSRNRHAAYYADQELASFPRESMHPWLHSTKPFLNNPVSMRRYAAEVSGIDDGVGRILDTLRRNGLDEKTLVIFTADQGWAGGQSGIWGMGDHTRPLTAYDSTMHVPLIFRQPSRVSAGKRAAALVSNYDILPTVLDLASLEARLPVDPPLPGRSFAPLLRGETVRWDDVAFYEFEDVRAVRTNDWKYVRRFPSGPNELYDVKNDPGERNNLIDDRPRAEAIAQLDRRLDDFFDRYADPQYDLTRGGRSKTPLITQPDSEPPRN